MQRSEQGRLQPHPEVQTSETVVAVQGKQAELLDLDQARQVSARSRLLLGDLPGLVAEREATSARRWIWTDTNQLAPQLLAAGVRVQRCLDLRLCRTILHHAFPDRTWPEPHWPTVTLGERPEPTLLDALASESDSPAPGGSADEMLAEHLRQQEAVAAAPSPGRFRLLLAAESAGALIAAEIYADGLPWDRQVHDEILTAELGPRPAPGGRPQRLAALAQVIRDRLEAPTLNPDSPVELLRALRRAGLDVSTTSKWALRELDHAVVEPLLEFKRMARLLSANGWAWMDAWVAPSTQPGRRDRFHPEYVPGGVITGRWATSGGGALQLPKQIRAAVRADPDWCLVVADAAQIEPRALAAMSGDRKLADASRGTDLYQSLVDAGVTATRNEAKLAMLGALYGATTGAAGQLMPRLMRTYPQATAVVENAARAGERGGVVRTWLGRCSVPPPKSWQEAQAAASQPGATAAVEARARQQARDWGRFTRNFVVQGTAAELALCWLAELRRRLARLGEPGERAHLVYFLHDEVIVHSPEPLAGQVAAEVAASLTEAGRLVFGNVGVDFPLQTAIVENYADAEH